MRILGEGGRWCQPIQKWVQRGLENISSEIPLRGGAGKYWKLYCGKHIANREVRSKDNMAPETEIYVCPKSTILKKYLREIQKQDMSQIKKE